MEGGKSGIGTGPGQVFCVMHEICMKLIHLGWPIFYLQLYIMIFHIRLPLSH